MIRKEPECVKCGSDNLDYCRDCGEYSLCHNCNFCSSKDCYEYKK